MHKTNQNYRNKLLDDPFASEFFKVKEDHTGHGAARLNKKKDATYRDLTDKEWETIFYKFLNDDMVDVPQDYYDEDILYDDPEQLMDIYSYLEE